jgi:hypothetical protein
MGYIDGAGNAQVALFPDPQGGVAKARVRNVGAAAAVKATPGNLYGLQVVNAQAATAFVQIFDAAVGGVTLGTTTPDLELQVVANSTVSLPVPTEGINFANAITVASTTEGGATPSAAGVQVFAQYA